MATSWANQRPTKPTNPHIHPKTTLIRLDILSYLREIYNHISVALARSSPAKHFNLLDILRLSIYPQSWRTIWTSFYRHETEAKSSKSKKCSMVLVSQYFL